MVFDRDYELNEGDKLGRDEQELVVKFRITLLINKPAGFISSDENEHGWPSYKQLIEDCPYANMVHIAGRLDVDTE
jgi:16S rRNA U516 pseudouridylate synthase RsuA-like enzyme